MIKPLQSLGISIGYSRSLHRHLADPLSTEAAGVRVRSLVAGREESFLNVLRASIFANQESPNRQLFQQGGIDAQRADQVVRQHGDEGALERYLQAGVFVTLMEYIGNAWLLIARPDITSCQDLDGRGTFTGQRPSHAGIPARIRPGPPGKRGARSD